MVDMNQFTNDLNKAYSKGLDKEKYGKAVERIIKGAMGLEIEKDDENKVKKSDDFER